MSDKPVREPVEADPDLDRSAPQDEPDERRHSNAPVRPSAAEGDEEDAGRRAPRPSQAEGDRDLD